MLDFKNIINIREKIVSAISTKISFFVNKKQIVLKYENKEPAEALMYKDTVYVPVTFVSEVLKTEFSFDIERKNIFFGEIPKGKHDFCEICSPISQNCCEIKEINGKKELIFKTIPSEKRFFSYISYQLNDFFKKLSFELVKASNKEECNSSFQILTDGINVHKFNKSNKNIEINLENISTLEFCVYSNENNAEYRIINAVIE